MSETNNKSDQQENTDTGSVSSSASCAQVKWDYGDHCDRCGLPFNGFVNHYGHGRVCNCCDVEMHQVYPYHGVRGYPAHQL
jgi:hypothetical protein